MSGLSFHYNGVKLVEEYKRIPTNSRTTKAEFNSSQNNLFTISIGIKPKLIVESVRNSSPAQEAGILPYDELIKINGKNVYDLKLEKIQSILSEEAGKIVKLELLRNEKIIRINFTLRDRLDNVIKKQPKK